jgi:hypothetical protein
MERKEISVSIVEDIDDIREAMRISVFTCLGMQKKQLPKCLSMTLM